WETGLTRVFALIIVRRLGNGNLAVSAVTFPGIVGSGLGLGLGPGLLLLLVVFPFILVLLLKLLLPSALEAFLLARQAAGVFEAEMARRQIGVCLQHRLENRSPHDFGAIAVGDPVVVIVA